MFCRVIFSPLLQFLHGLMAQYDGDWHIQVRSIETKMLMLSSKQQSSKPNEKTDLKCAFVAVQCSRPDRGGEGANNLFWRQRKARLRN